MDQLYKDIYNFGEVILEILRNGEEKKEVISSKEILLREIYSKNEIFEIPDDESILSQEEMAIKSVFEVALLCTSSRPSERPSMEEALRLLLDPKSQRTS